MCPCVDLVVQTAINLMGVWKGEKDTRMSGMLGFCRFEGLF